MKPLRKFSVLLNRTKSKLRDERGESLSEILIALLISALGIVLLAGMINLSSSMITDSRDRVADYVQADISVVERSSPSSTGTVKIKVGENAIELTDGVGSVEVDYFCNSENERVRSYKVKP